MSAVPLIALRAVFGGCLVVAFALVGEWLRPKSFSGLFAAAPSVALASLVITDVTRGAHATWLSALGMLTGAVAFTAAAVVAVDAVKRFGATRGALVSIAVWGVVAASLWAVALR